MAFYPGGKRTPLPETVGVHTSVWLMSLQKSVPVGSFEEGCKYLL